MARRLGILIFGATGYTGKVVVEKILTLSNKVENLSWGVAGRNENKLKELLAEVSKKTGQSLKDVEVVVANVGDEVSLKNMTKKCKVLINCVGPYRHWGEQTVKACIETGTHHVDVSGEPEYMERMQLLYHKAAEEKGVYVISACGFDSLPAEIGCLHFMQQFDGDVNSVETFLQMKNKKQKGPAINYATWECMVHGLANAKDLRPIRKQLFPERLPPMTPKLKPRGSVFNNPVGKGWCMPFLGSDQSVMRRSQYFFHDKKGQRPVQVQCYFSVTALSTVITFIIVGAMFNLLTKYKWGQKLLLKHPKIFSFGFVGSSDEGPDEESRKRTEFNMTFIGDGWSEKRTAGQQHTSLPDTKVVTKISGVDPAYGVAAIGALLCANTILSEADKMPSRGGVYPPGAAFFDTSLMAQLEANGVKFEVVEKRKVSNNKL
ncbi:saccharopine dehydrogenase-like oxidoreductase [Neocloeon triangulifer]|uniref:saccharopine dehydrogenase-like oxidoreductase n=1 Tax=Neocloeon triangulifer TaxID=2078957 RepID=UPI00286F9CD1|nr:saccharopine dehydrogenase-like oxidoreductase [Neocloeon triangulifer]